jgi:ferrochelatase
MSKQGILLVNLGTPDSPSTANVRKYLDEFLMDERVIDINPVSRALLVKGIIVPFRSPKSAKLYQGDMVGYHRIAINALQSAAEGSFADNA